MPVVKLNARNITTLPAIGGVRTDYRDELLPGFFLRVTPPGTRSFGIVYTTRDGRLRRARSVRWDRSACRTRERRRGGSAERSLKVKIRTATG